MRMFSVLVNSGADPTLEDCRGHNAQYYMDNQSEIVIPEWTNRWSNMITAQDRSPSPERRQEQINYRTVTVKRKLERLQFSTSSSFFKI